MITLPTRTDLPRYNFRIVLDEKTFDMHFEWNDRAGAWFLDVYDAANELLVSGVRIVVGFPFLEKYLHLGVPNGLMQAIDTSGQDLEPGFADLGERVLLVYTPVAEL
jgi:hypothetical protein